MPRRLTSAIVTALLAVAVVVVGAGSAHAAAYRYWTYWQGGTGTWAFATAGPASTVPADGSVEGWRFAVTAAAGQAADAPGPEPSFAQICGATPEVADRKRVALVVDSGSAATAPEGQTPPAPVVTCVVAELDATGYQVLRSVAAVRTDGGLICAIADYPVGECAPVIENPVDMPSTSGTTTSGSTAAREPAATESAMATAPAEQPGASPGTPWLTAAVVAVLVVVGLILWRRRRHG